MLVSLAAQYLPRFGLTSVHHSGGNLFALQHVRADGNLLHRVSYEASGDILEAMIKTGIETGLGDEWIRFGATRTLAGRWIRRAEGRPFSRSERPHCQCRNMVPAADCARHYVPR